MINHYPVDSVACIVNSYPLDSVLFGDSAYEQLGCKGGRNSQLVRILKNLNPEG